MFSFSKHTGLGGVTSRHTVPSICFALDVAVLVYGQIDELEDPDRSGLQALSMWCPSDFGTFDVDAEARVSIAFWKSWERCDAGWWPFAPAAVVSVVNGWVMWKSGAKTLHKTPRELLQPSASAPQEPKPTRKRRSQTLHGATRMASGRTPRHHRPPRAPPLAQLHFHPKLIGGQFIFHHRIFQRHAARCGFHTHTSVLTKRGSTRASIIQLKASVVHSAGRW